MNWRCANRIETDTASVLLIRRVTPFQSEIKGFKGMSVSHFVDEANYLQNSN